MKDLLSALNPEQRQAVCHESGPILVLAGAGSGKTRVLTHRLAYLVRECAVDPRRLLAVTFTNKAAREMRERVEALIDGLPRDVWIGTFHAICSRLLRRHGQTIEINPSFAVYDDSDQMTLMRQCLTYHNVDEKRFPPRSVLSEIGRAKDKLITPEQYSKHALDPYQETVAPLYRTYQERLSLNNALDFDDLIMRTVELLDRSPQILEHYQKWFQYLLVDEYQDINFAQYSILKRLAQKHRNLCVVGDDDQSIYAFRGADVSIILAFQEDYPDARVVKLERNYRSTSTILEAAWAVVSKNSNRTPKKLWTDRASGDQIHLYEALDERDEAAFVLNRVEALMGRFAEGPRRTPKDIAVLYRVNSLSRVLEEEFMRRRVAYRIVGGQRFYDRKEVKDALAYLRLISNPSDSVSLRRVINTPARGIGNVSIERLDAFAEAQGITLFESAGRVREVEGITPRIKQSVSEFHRLIDELRGIQDRTPVSVILIQALERSGYITELQRERSTESESRMENLKELLTVAKEFEKASEDGTLGAFLEQASLATDADTQAEGQEAVTMMTLHAAKGLEFPVVFLVGLEEGLLPHSRSKDDASQLEEERRLCYVGITRAKDSLFMSYAGQRQTFGERLSTKRSRFVEEVPEGLFAQAMPGKGGATSKPKSLWERMSAPTERQVALGQGNGDAAPKPKAPYKVGQKVRHAKFGEGMVLACTPGGDDCQVTIAFADSLVKKLALAYAKLDTVD
ncbi:MAG TPA: DNA helicase PcrA [Armatimonadota bacterium]